MTDENDNEELTGPIPGNVSLAGAADAGGVADYIVAKEGETKFEKWVDQISDFCSSILVKETRQAVKSRHFFSTFMLLLTLVIIWTCLLYTSPSPRDRG